MAIDKKTKLLFRLMEIFLTQKEITAYDEHILQEFDCKPKTLERYLKDLENIYDHIIQVKRDKKNVWKLIKVSDIFEEFIKNGNDLYTLFELAREFDPEIFKELEKGTLKKLATNESLFVYKNNIMEELNDSVKNEIFKDLRQAVKDREYRDIYYQYDGDIIYEDVKPLKLVFINNNWYIAVVTKEKKFQFLRLNFIQEVKKRYSQGRFQSVDIEQYVDFIAQAQNAMSLFGVTTKTAIIKVNKNVAKYFKEGMKKQIATQKYIEELDDGSVLISIEYTQELEILPLIQKWLPDLIIQEPQELKEAMKEKLQKALNYYN